MAGQWPFNREARPTIGLPLKRFSSGLVPGLFFSLGSATVFGTKYLLDDRFWLQADIPEAVADIRFAAGCGHSQG